MACTTPGCTALDGGDDADDVHSSAAWVTSAVQKIQKLSESPATAHMVAKLCVINCKNRKITQKLVQPVTPGGYSKWPFYNVKMAEKVPNLRMGLKSIQKW